MGPAPCQGPTAGEGPIQTDGDVIGPASPNCDGGYADELTAAGPQIDSGNYPMLKRIVTDAELPHMDPDARFERGLSRLLDGIAANLPARPASGGHDTGGDENTTTHLGN